jgi:hypothetical protein
MKEPRIYSLRNRQEQAFESKNIQYTEKTFNHVSFAPWTEKTNHVVWTTEQLPKERATRISQVFIRKPKWQK